MVVGVVMGPASPALAIARGSGLSTAQPIDGIGPVDPAEPGTPEWDELNLANAYARHPALVDDIERHGVPTCPRRRRRLVVLS